MRVKYVYFDWKRGKPEEEDLRGDKEFCYETSKSKNACCDGFEFLVSDTELSQEEVDLLNESVFDCGGGGYITINETVLKKIAVDKKECKEADDYACAKCKKLNTCNYVSTSKAWEELEQ